MMKSWYAVQVRTGREESILRLCREIVDKNVLDECFIPYGERMKRYRGRWHKEQHILFPGYVFLITAQVRELFWELKKIPEFTKILGDGADFIPIKEDEKKLLQLGGTEHLFKMSLGYIKGDKVIVISGPMQKMKGTITYIDRHKRLAVIRMEMFERWIDVTMGLEVIRKE